MLEIDERPIGPQPLRQLLASDDVARAFEHHPENLEGLLLQTDQVLALPQLARAYVEFERFKA